ncbi:MAG: AMP-binding protein, partial [Polyangiales bacterium]
MTGVHRSELTPVAFLERTAYLHPGRIAVAHEDGRRITYGELEERCHRFANALRGRGLQHGDRVAVLSPNAPAILEAHYGVPLAGGVLVAINTRLAPAEIDLIVRHSGARILLVDHALVPLVEPLDLGGI